MNGRGWPVPGKTRDFGPGLLGLSPDARRDAPEHRRLGPVSTDFTAVTINASPDGSYNQAYTITGSTYSTGYPLDLTQGTWVASAGFASVSAPQVGMSRLIRFMCDGDKIAVTLVGVHGLMIYIDGSPTQLTPYTTITGTTFQTITFPSAKPRLIEFKTTAPVGNLYCAMPYRMWKAPPLRGPRVLVVGDSYVAPTIWQDAAAVGDLAENGCYQQMDDQLGCPDFWTEGVGGAGYGVNSSGAAAGTDRLIDRVAAHVACQPDLLVVHGGGANDLANGRSTAQTVADATTYFTAARAGLPTARLVFLEGFSPPVSFSGFNASYASIRASLQVALSAVGVYYVDVATSSPWIDGAGYFAHTTGTGNGDTYIGNDGVHPNVKGHRYLRLRLAPKLRRIMADDGATLVNTLVSA